MPLSPELAAELARLPDKLRGIVAALVAGETPLNVAKRLGYSLSYVTTARTRVAETLGPHCALCVAIPRRRRGRPSKLGAESVGDRAPVRLWTTRAPDGHRHVAVFDSETCLGYCETANGHTHQIADLEVRTAEGHAHELSGERA